MNKIKYIDLFAGAGGLSLGLYKAGLEGVFAIEKNEDAFSTLKFNLIDNKKHFEWPSWLPQTSHDINEVLKKYKDNLLKLKGSIDLIVGGPPCQGFSMAGQRDHSDHRNQLVYSYLEMVKVIEPKHVFFENVAGFNMKFKDDELNKPYSKLVIEKLSELGYFVRSFSILMSDFGVPQKRKRFILVGSKNESFVKKFLENLKEIKDEQFKKTGINSSISVIDAIDDLKKEYGVIDSPDSSSKFKNGLYGPSVSNYQKLMRKDAPEIPNSHRFANHTERIIKLHKKIQEKLQPGKRISPQDGLIPNLKRRGVTLLDENGVSPTITSIPDEIVHYSEPRILTPREMARIQSFPDWYEFKGKYTTGGILRKTDVPRYTQIANAVPPLFAEQIGLVFNKYLKQ